MDDTIFTVLKLLGSLALLMYGMKVMSEGLRKLTGDHLRNILGTMTTNRFAGLLTGAFITAAVQSSNATTVMTVSFVNAGLLTSTFSKKSGRKSFGESVFGFAFMFLGPTALKENAMHMDPSYNIEKEINNYRNLLKQHNVEDINDKDYQGRGILYGYHQ